MREGDKLRVEMKKFKVKGRELASLLGISEVSMSLKLNGKRLWVDEAFIIHEYIRSKGSTLTMQELFS